MNEDKEFLINKSKSDSRVLINVTLLGICFTLFTFIVTIKPELLNRNIYLTLQLVCAIPILMNSIFTRSKLGYTIQAKKWNDLGFITFLLGYSFLVNVVGILLISLISFKVGIIYFIVNIFSAIVYSYVDISYDKSRLRERLWKDGAFILLIIILGILPTL